MQCCATPLDNQISFFDEDEFKPTPDGTSKVSSNDIELITT